MTPQEKAKELVEQYRRYAFHEDLGYHEMEMHQELNNAKECALIAVDYIVRTCHYEAQEEWQQVKEEIQKL